MFWEKNTSGKNKSSGRKRKYVTSGHPVKLFSGDTLKNK